MNHDELEFYPLTAGRWDDFEQLFGPNGAYAGCWCMWWRLKRSTFTAQQGEGNKEAMRLIVESEEAPGILAYQDGRPIGWCSVAPREAFPALGRSPVVKPVDDEPAWSIVCFYVARRQRRQGVMTALLQAAVAHAVAHGATNVEGYPVVPRTGRLPDPNAYHGLPQVFRDAGFVEVLRRSAGRPIMRYYAAPADSPEEL